MEKNFYGFSQFLEHKKTHNEGDSLLHYALPHHQVILHAQCSTSIAQGKATQYNTTSHKNDKHNTTQHDITHHNTTHRSRQNKTRLAYVAFIIYKLISASADMSSLFLGQLTRSCFPIKVFCCRVVSCLAMALPLSCDFLRTLSDLILSDLVFQRAVWFSVSSHDVHLHT